VGADRSLDYDGSVTVGAFIATDDLWTPLRRQIVFNNHPLFSFLDHLVWLAGGQSELVLLALPVLCGAAGAAVLAGWTAARGGAAAGVVAGALLAANPAYAQLSRSVRGYSLMTAAVITATVVLLEDERRRGSRWRAFAYVALMALAVGTHLYAGLALLAHAVWLAAARRLSRERAVQLVGAGALGLAVYSAMIGGMLREARNRPRLFHSDFPVETVRMVLGDHGLAVVLLAPVVVWAAWAARRSRPATLSAVAVAAALAIVWVGIRPADLYPRFLLPLAGLAAAGAVLVTRRRGGPVGGAAGAALLVALAAMVVQDARHWSEDPAPFKAAAGIAHAAAFEGHRPCAALFYGEAFAGYGITPPPAETPADLAACDVLFVVEGSARELATAARSEYPHRRTLRGADDITVYARTADVFDAPPAGLAW
jgi:hypothetical protein